MPHESGLAQGIANARASMGETPETSRHPPAEDTGKPQGRDSQQNPGFSCGSQSVADFAFRQEEEDDDDRESVVDLPPPDKTYSQLVNCIHERFPHSRPSSVPRL